MRTPAEISLAKRLVDKLGLKPPIDIATLAARYALVTRVKIPEDVDGLCLHLKRPGVKPHIIVNIKDRGEYRIRFTLAHELGHVLIPWHLGTIVDNTNLDASASSEYYWEMEAEANRFASELLMPTSWVENVIALGDPPPDTADFIAKKAKVSLHAAVIKLINTLPKGYIYAQLRDGVVQSSGRSPGTIANEPAWYRELPEDIYPWTKNHWNVAVGGNNYHWWNFKADDTKKLLVSDQPWREVLDNIVNDLMLDDQQIKKFKASLNGSLAFANSSCRDRTPQALRDACLQRIHSRAMSDRLMKQFTAHPRMELFLSARVIEFLK